MKVLVACEFSGRVRDAFTKLGHDAMSCDFLPSETPGKHYTGDIRDLINDYWDLMICHPPCTFLAVSQAWCFYHPEDKKLPPLKEDRIQSFQTGDNKNRNHWNSVNH